MTRRGWLVGAAALLAACASQGGMGGPGGERGGRGMFMGDPLRTEHLNSGTANGIEGFTQALRVGQNVYVSGQVALDDQGRVVGPGDVRAQAEQAFANLERTLGIAGALPSEVLRLTVYVVGLKPGDWAVIREAGAKFFPERNPPAGTVVGIAALPRDSLLIAIDAAAVVRAEFRPRR